jgi:hypothetical protein
VRGYIALVKYLECIKKQRQGAPGALAARPDAFIRPT